MSSSTTSMQAVGRCFESESQFAAYDQPATSTSYNNISSYPEERECNNNTKIGRHNYVYARYLSIKRRAFRLKKVYLSIKRRAFRLKKVYSTRARGRCGPIQSLARKLGRFKVRTVVVNVGTANGESDPKR